MMAQPVSKVVAVLIVWCAALTVAVLGVVCFLVTTSVWRKDCKEDTVNKKLEGKPNTTRPLSTHSPPSSSNGPSNYVSSAKDHARIADQKCRSCKLRIAHLVANAGGLDVDWKHSSRESVLQDMVAHRNGSIVIPERGFYYVYSQVAFLGANCSSDSLVLESIVLYRPPDQSAGRLKELMETTESVCESARPGLKWQRSLRQGGVFQLDKGTHLSVKMRPLRKAELEHHKTYFGAFKLQ